ncbi:MAG: SCP2 sterol-binding domain-containing protein [Gammaproteobacteria bacterium]|nr:SCP2 sterol-binding domain-containing protein [Gammaproteobacteria bacterium]
MLQKISHSINAVLRLDQDVLADLIVLQGNTVRIDIKGLELKIDICIIADGIELLLPVDDRQPEIVVSGPPLALLDLLVSKNQLQSTQSSDVYMAGDMQLARKLEQIIKKLDIDWEEWLAQKTGDVMAHQLGDLSRQLWGWCKRVNQSLQIATGEYLQEESGQLPTRVETEHFKDEVDSIHDSVERLEARILALQE